MLCLRPIKTLRALQDGKCQRVIGTLLHGGGQKEQFLLLHAGSGADLRHLRAALRDSAGLVEHNGVHAVDRLQAFRCLEEDAVFSALSRADHDSCRRGKAERAGAGDDKHGNTNGKRKLERLARDQPGNRRNHGDGDDYRHKDGAHLIGQAGYGCLRGVCVLHQTDDLRERRILTDARRLHLQPAGFADRAARDAVPRLFLHRHALTGEGRLVHRGRAFQDAAVHRDGSAGLHDEDIARLHLLERNLLLLAVAQKHRRLGRQIHQPGNGVGRAALGACLQQFAYRDQRKDGAGGLKIQIHGVMVHERQIAVAQSPSDVIDGENAVCHGGTGADGNERIHGGRALRKRFETGDIKFPVDIQDGQHEQKLRKRKCQRVLPAQQKAGQRQAHHVAH